MSYRKEEQKIQWKLRRIMWIVFAVILVLVIALSIFSSFVPPVTWKYYFYLPSVSAREEGELRIHCIDVGQGDCTLVEFPDGKTMLVDGGNGQESATTAIMRYLNGMKIDYLDYVVLTHTDSDHCGGLDTILQYKSVGTVCYPSAEEATVNAEYASFYTVLTTLSCQKEENHRGYDISSNDERYPYKVVWAWPYGSGTPNSQNYTGNDKSAVIWIDYGEKEGLLMGDVTTTVQDRLRNEGAVGLLPDGIDITSVDLLKVSHHGALNGTSEDFLTYIQADKALISCGANNPYGHPSFMTMTLLNNNVDEIYRTDTQGTVVFTWGADGTHTVTTSR